MAIAIKTISTLKGKTAENFIKTADHNSAKRATEDFRKQVQVASAILRKAKFG
ncbi:hypothetical protein [Dysgonomonas sp.]|jgi:hypothetical protein|uniref:hypothetical protein n=1 Tax=Dysgonomonas sp. TaxID=1891233 RepID=UPI002C6677E3|nr:hypothetical protein [Dysgonomonas sp.]HMM03869.1 hypothetical protein [Dysgonomonas sp.]